LAFNHLQLEDKWQKIWDEKKCFNAVTGSDLPKYYALSMFPYPSGHGLHVGHLASYTPTEIVARYKRAKGFNVLHPMGYDAFGLPAEQFAIQTGVHPEKTTQESIKNFKRQLQSFGYSYDWNRELSTCDPKFYKWTQFIFKKLFEKGLAYQKEVPVNWCPALRTVLANEEVIDGKSERGDHPVVRTPMKQWMLKITDYADRLLDDLDKVDWPHRTIEGQRNWVGRSTGAMVNFSVEGCEDIIEVFTTRPDTLFGATFMVLAPEHELVNKITSDAQQNAITKYVEDTSKKSEINRKSSLEKTGVFTGGYAVNPANNEKVPIWIADYVLLDYGSGAIMAVPAHDERDFEFATQFKIPIKRVIESKDELPFSGNGPHINSDFLDGLNTEDAIEKMSTWLQEKKLGEKKIQYKLRDWLFSRQRYWGEPFPVIRFPDGDLKSVPDDELPVLLPDVADYQPTEKGEPPLARVDDFVNYTEKETGKPAFRITDTMPGSAGSSWYFLRYTDPNNESAICDFDAQKYWMPVDLYLGGPEHTVGHLLYSRFWQKVLFDAGLVSHEEPFQRLAHQGLILGNDGQKMSKSKGNVINPDDMREQFGADATRIYVSFMGPFERDKPWATQGVEGIRRFLDRIWRLVFDEEGQVIATEENFSKELNRTLHKTIKKVEGDIESLNFNTAISAMMILVNETYKENVKPVALLKTLSQLLQPFAPHFAEEIWSSLDGEGLVSTAPWPSFEESLTKDDSVTMGIQVNGKMRGTIDIATDASQDEAVVLAKGIQSVQNAIEGKNIVKIIYRSGKILNLIAK
jgi:leucyl-tRNA synthetase